MDDVEPLFQALTAIHPRSAQVLMARFFWNGDRLGRSRPEFATHYGISLEAADVLLFRAAVEFFERLTGRKEPTLAEASRASTFGQAIEGSIPAGEFNDLVLALRGLSANARELSKRLEAAERAELSSPEYARETWLRRVAIVAILALSAWFYWKAELTSWWQHHAGDTTIDAGQ